MRKLDLTALRRVHFLTDCLLVSLGWLGVYALRASLDGLLGPINPVAPYVKALPLIVVPWMAVCWIFGIYPPHSGRRSCVASPARARDRRARVSRRASQSAPDRE